MKTQKLNFNVDWKEVAASTKTLRNKFWQLDNVPTGRQSVNNDLLIDAIVAFLGDFDVPVSYRKVRNILINPPYDWLSSIIHKIRHLYAHKISFPNLLTEYNQILLLFPDYESSQCLEKTLATKIMTFETFNPLAKIKLSELKGLLPIIEVQIFNLSFLPFDLKKLPLTKLMAMWYLNQTPSKIPFLSYQKALDLVGEEYNQQFFHARKTNNYTGLIRFVIQALDKYKTIDKMTQFVDEQVLKQKGVALAKHELTFLFLIIYHQLTFFDWKKFQTKANFFATKQHIIRNLNAFLEYRLLRASFVKNRKFYTQTAFLKTLQKDFTNYE